MADIIDPMLLRAILIGLSIAFITWVFGRLWKRHGPRMADQFPAVDKVGLTESPVNRWFEDAIALTDELCDFWSKKITQRHIHSRDIREAHRKTVSQIKQFRKLKTNPPDKVPQEAIDRIDDFVEDWGERQGYFDESMPEEIFREEGDKIQSNLQQVKSQLKEERQTWKSGK